MYKKPANLFVADFVGNPSINFIDGVGGQNDDGSVSLDILNGYKAKFIPSNSLDLGKWRKERDEFEGKKLLELKAKSKEKGYVEKGNKDEVFKYHIQKVVEEDDSLSEDPVITDRDFVLGVRPECLVVDENGKLEGEIYGAMPTGMESTIKVRIGDYLLTGVIFGDLAIRIGSKVRLNINSDRIMLFDRKSGKIIATGSLEIS